MSRWADWFTISADEAAEFVAAKKRGDDDVESMLQPWLERLDTLTLHVAMDKAWEPIHRCLTGDRSTDLFFTCGTMPLKLTVLGGRQIYRDDYRSASLVDADKVPRVEKALAKIDEHWMREQFFALPDTQFHDLNDEVFEWLWEHFNELPPFFARAAKDGNAVICTVSH